MLKSWTRSLLVASTLLLSIPVPVPVHAAPPDCNTNGIDDTLEGLSDCDSNGIPDICQGIGGSATNLYTSAAVLPILDFQQSSAPINVAGVGTVSDVNVGVNIVHTFDGDLTLTMAHLGTTVTLVSGIGGSGDNFSNTIFDDEAFVSIGSGAAPFAGTFQPFSSLSAFDGSSDSGVWTLSASDSANLDTGTLLGWQLEITTAGGGGINDCNTNGQLDSCDIAFGGSFDNNFNNIPDECELINDCNTNGIDDSLEGLADCDSNAIPDVCQFGGDCNSNGILDACEFLPDCNTNGNPDQCDILSGFSFDNNFNGVPDECESINDCNTNGIDDSLEGLPDCDSNGIPDICQVGGGNTSTYSSGAVFPIFDFFSATSPLNVPGSGVVSDVNVTVQIIHTWDADLSLDLQHLGATAILAFGVGGSGDNFNGTVFDDEAATPIGLGTAPFNGTFSPASPLSVFDGQSDGGIWSLTVVDSANGDTGSLISWSLEITTGGGIGGADCNTNGQLDDCDIAFGGSVDNNSNNVPDECEPINDCNTNGIDDGLEGLADCDSNAIPDVCQIGGDCNSNGIPDVCEFLLDCDSNGIPDVCQVGGDCNSNGIPDACEFLPDCNTNGNPDECDILFGFSSDANFNLVPDECEGGGDCNTNAIPDIFEGLPDCDLDGTPDECEGDCDTNGIPDDCEPDIDCNSNGVPDLCDLTVYLQQDDCNTNGILDECEAPVDCNSDGIPDECELFTLDCNDNGILDECEPGFGDCNSNGLPDDCEFYFDCNTNLIPDGCEPGGDEDCDFNLIPDWCEASTDCNTNGVPDYCDGIDDDCNTNGVPDFICEGLSDCNTDGLADECEGDGDNTDCNTNDVRDDCEIAGMPMLDANTDGILDECAPPGCTRLTGDLNEDGCVDGEDIQQFVSCVLDGNTVGCECADMNGDLMVTSADIALFVVKQLVALIPCSCNVGIDSNNNGYTLSDTMVDDPIETNAPGKLICLNDDDDDQSGMPDKDDLENLMPGFPVYENDTEMLLLSSNCKTMNRKWRLTFGPKVKLWSFRERSDKTNPTTPSYVSGGLRDFPMPSIVWVEGVETSTASGDVTIKLEIVSDDGMTVYCSDEVKATVVQLEILDSASAAAEFLRIGHFGSDSGGGVDGYTGGNVLKNDMAGTFIDNDPDRYKIRARNPAANTNAGAKDKVTVKIATLTSALAEDDDDTEIELVETGNNTGIFDSEMLLLCSPDLPTNPDDDITVYSAVSAGVVADDVKNDRTHRASIDGFVRATYKLAFQTVCRRQIPVCKRGVDDERRIATVRNRVYLEPFTDTGFDHDGMPATPVFGAGNGTFDYTDTNLNGMHDKGEPSELYLDLSSGAAVYRRGDDAMTASGRGPIMSDAHVASQMVRANIGWAQACIKVVQSGGVIHDNAPNDGGGTNIIADGLFNDTADTAFAINALAGVTDDRAEFFYVAELKPAGNAFADFPSVLKSEAIVDVALHDNSYSFIGPNLVLTARTCAHELGHLLTNQGDVAVPKHTFFPGTFPYDDSKVNEYRRIRHATETTARTVRAAGMFDDPGNRLLKKP